MEDDGTAVLTHPFCCLSYSWVGQKAYSMHTILTAVAYKYILAQWDVSTSWVSSAAGAFPLGLFIIFENGTLQNILWNQMGNN